MENDRKILYLTAEELRQKGYDVTELREEDIAMGRKIPECSVIFTMGRNRDTHTDIERFLSDSKENLPVSTNGAAMQILIGPENVSDALKDSSVVIASYDIGENMRGLVGVVGPTRMDYATVAARLSYFAESLSRMFGKPRELPPGEEKEI